MDMNELQEAARIVKKIEEHDRLVGDLAAREIDFVEHDRRRSLGCMQISESESAALRVALREAADDWFDKRRAEMTAKLRDMGVTVSDERPVRSARVAERERAA